MKNLAQHLLLLAFASGCNTVQRGACEDLALEICDECNISGWDKDVHCACLEDGKVKNYERYFEDETTAEVVCTSVQNSVRKTYQTKETTSECRQGLELFDEHGKDACVAYGYEISGGGQDSGRNGGGQDSGRNDNACNACSE